MDIPPLVFKTGEKKDASSSPKKRAELRPEIPKSPKDSANPIRNYRPAAKEAQPETSHL